MQDAVRYYAVIADDHAIVRAGLRSALEQPGFIEPAGIKIVAEAQNGLEAIAAVRKDRPDLLLLDVQMPLAGGIEVLEEVRRWSPDTRIVVLTGVTAVGMIAVLIDSGVNGLFSKGDDNAELYRRLPGILRGQRHISGTFIEMLGEAEDKTELTGREHQIFNLILRGQGNKEMATTLGISPKTVDKHRTSMMQKLGVRSVPQLLSYAIRNGMVDSSSEL